MQLRNLILPMLAVAALGSAQMARADGPAIEFASTVGDNHDGFWSLGFQFTVASNAITVDSLGFYEQDSIPWTISHDVGIYDLSQNLLASATVNPLDPKTGHFRYHAIAPIVLSANTSYVIAGTTGKDDNYTANPNGFTVDPAITFDLDLYVSSVELAYPLYTGGEGYRGYFGPNFTLSVVSGTQDEVPEPGTLAISVGAISAVGILSLRRRRK